MVRRTVTSIATLCVLAVAAACSGGSDPGTEPPLSSSSATTTAPSTGPSTAAPPQWQSKYTAGQVRLYNEALQRWTDYERRSEPIWAEGRATSLAKRLFKEYFLAWKAEYSRLKTYQQIDVKTLGTPTVYWSRPLSITSDRGVSHHGVATVIKQCVDYRPVRTTQHGKPVKAVKRFERPVIRDISMMKVGNVTWLVDGVDDVLDGKATPCDPNA